MMKLNGKTYLTYQEVQTEISYHIGRFSTSQHTLPPQGISYVDAEFITQIKEKANDMEVALGFLYKNETYVELNEVVETISSFFYDHDTCDASISFLTAQLTDSQRKLYREAYYHYLFNIFSGEVIKTLISKFS
jgi:hypothetical protein